MYEFKRSIMGWVLTVLFHMNKYFRQCMNLVLSLIQVAAFGVLLVYLSLCPCKVFKL